MKKLIIAVAVIFTIALSAFTKVTIKSNQQAGMQVDKTTPVTGDFIAQSPISAKANLAQADIN